MRSPSRVLVVGGGGREHALCWRLAQDPGVDRVLAAPGNALMRDVADVLPIALSDHEGLVELARSESVDLVVVGPEGPLAAGLADALRASGVPVFGPSAGAARIETSKAFCREIAREAGIPMARGGVFTHLSEALEAVRRLGAPVVVKADGLAAGKGVAICRTVEEAEQALVTALVDHAFGSAGESVIVEEALEGPELSLIALSDGDRSVVLPPARDHKRLRDGDSGPNTGGMGACAPVGVPAAQVLSLHERFHRPCLRALAGRGAPFVGALYAGLMLTPHGPRLLEFNARFGDPEAQAILPLVQGSLTDRLAHAAHGRLDSSRDSMYPWAGASVAVVLAAGGYPERPATGDFVAGIPAARQRGVLLFGGAIEERGAGFVTAGGRVLTVVGRGPDEAAARSAAYAAADEISFPGMQLRRDIGGPTRVAAPA